MKFEYYSSIKVEVMLKRAFPLDWRNLCVNKSLNKTASNQNVIIPGKLEKIYK